MAQHLLKFNPNEKIDSEQLIKILKPDFSPIGHHRRQSQEIVMTKFIAFLKSMEGMFHVTKSLQDKFQKGSYTLVLFMSVIGLIKFLAC